MDVLQKIEQHLESPLSLEGYDIVRIQLTGTKYKILQIMVDRLDDNQISLDDCEKVSRLSSILLDQLDAISDQYNLEVSSAGMERPLTKPKHFEKFKGDNVTLITHFLIKDRKKFTGMLEKVDEHGITLKVDESLSDGSHEIELKFSDIRSAKLKIAF